MLSFLNTLPTTMGDAAAPPTAVVLAVRMDAAGLLTMGRTTIQVEITTEIRVPPGFWANMRHSRFQNQSASRR